MPAAAPRPAPPPRPAAAIARRLAWDELDPAYLRQLITLAREEDLSGAGLKAPVAPGDVTTVALAGDAPARAELVAREALTVCGLRLLALVLESFGPGCAAHFPAGLRDGAAVARGTVVATLTGPAATLLSAERTALNFIQKLSGLATHAARHVAALGWTPTKLLDTRKTTPGYRMLEKYAVGCGGAFNHRLGLFDRVLIKDNHLAAAGATDGDRLAEAVRAARARWPQLLVECEVDRLAQIEPVLEAGADIVLFDNFSPGDLVEAVALVNRRACTEASGGVTLAALPELGRIGLDFISCGALVHHAPWADLGLDWR